MLLQISHLMMNMMWKYKKGLHHTLGGHIKKDLHQTLGPDIQIKICAEYRDMLPRPRLVFQVYLTNPAEAWVPCLVFCTDLNLFYSIHSLFFIPLWVWLGTLQDCIHAQCPLSLTIVIRMRLVIRQSKLPACLAEVRLVHKKHSLAFMP